MSAIRYMRSIHPKIIEQQHRLNIYHRKKKVVTRKRKKKSTGQSGISGTTEDVDIIDLNFKLPSIQSSDVSFGSDICQSEDEAVFSECQTPVTRPSDTKESVVKEYERACKLYDALPLTRIAKELLQKCMTCKSFQLQDKDCKAICNALLNNRFVERLNFQDNGMGPDPAYYFADVMQESVFLTHIRLADNDLRSEGAKIICKAVSMNPKIVCLDLSGNGLVDSDGVYIRNLIQDSNTLKELYLAKNQLMDVGVRHIVEGLECTTTLNVLDISWNHIRLKGASAICQALENNSSLQSVNLAWNGLHKNGAKLLARALKKNRRLTELDITCNRLTEYCIDKILQGLQRNTTLKTLRMGRNHVSAKAALSILQKIHDNKTSGIKLLDLGSQEVYDKFEELYKDMQKERDITVLYGSVRNSDKTSFAMRQTCDKELVLLTYDPLTVLMECMRQKNMRLLDFFRWLDADNDSHICINELCDGMMKAGIPFRRQTLLRLLHRLDMDNNNLLDFREMTAALNLHRENVRNILAENAGTDFEQTKIGKVSSLIRNLMDKSTALRRAELNEKAKRRRSSIFSTILTLTRRSRKNTPPVLPGISDVSVESVDAASDGQSVLNTLSSISKSAEMSQASNSTTHYPNGSSASSVETTATSHALSTASLGRIYSAGLSATSSLKPDKPQKTSLKFPEIITKAVVKREWDSAFKKNVKQYSV